MAGDIEVVRQAAAGVFEPASLHGPFDDSLDDTFDDVRFGITGDAVGRFGDVSGDFAGCAAVSSSSFTHPVRWSWMT